MKRVFISLLTLINSGSIGFSDEPTTNNAAIIGHLSTGDPTVKNTVPGPATKHTILGTTRYCEQGRTVNIHEVTPPIVSTRKVEVAVATEMPPPSPSAKENNLPVHKPMLTLGAFATVFGRGAEKRTHLKVWCQGRIHECLSNVDFLCMSGFQAFRANGREYFYLSTTVGAKNTQGRVLGLAGAAAKGLPVNHQRLLSSQPEFVVLSGNREARAMSREIFNDLHTLYRVEKNRLVQAHAQRAANAQITARTQQKEHPSPLDDITINFWKRDTHKERTAIQRENAKKEGGAKP